MMQWSENTHIISRSARIRSVVTLRGDDLNIPFGTLRLRKNGSAGGHNGLTNITELIGTQEYARIRVGIGNDFGRGQQVGYVLGELSPEEKKEMEQISKRVIDGVKAWATIGPDRAMNTVNTKPKTIASEGETQAK